MELKTNYPEYNNTSQAATHELYQRYGSMLLGYITDVVKDTNLAEQYLIAVFKEVVNRFEEINTAGNKWLKIQKLAKQVLSSFSNTVMPDSCVINSAGSTITNSYLKLMSMAQQEVFCGIHYHQKSTAVLAAELNKTEQTIKQLLREALIIIRNEQKR